MVTTEQIERNFKYHPPKPEAALAFVSIREKAKELALLVEGVVPAGREQSLAVTNLEQAVMWANAGIARQP